jgi:hypothetical protein
MSAMHRRNVYLIGGGGVAAAVLFSVLLLVRWWTAPIDIPREPLPTYPNPNAYELYRTLAVQLLEQEKVKPAYRKAAIDIADGIRRRRPLDSPEIRQYLQAMEPARLAYRRFLDMPSRVILSYRADDLFPELRGFHHWARVETADVLLAINTGDYARVVDNYRTVLLLSEQIRNGGSLIHHLVASSCVSTICPVIGGAICKLPVSECVQLVEATREWERRRVPVEQAYIVERAWHINILHDFYEGKIKVTPEWLGEQPEALRRLPSPKWLNLRAAAHELDQLYQLAIVETRKPVLQQAKLPQPRHVINAMLLPVYDTFPRQEAVRTARIRLLGVAAAVRAYRLKHGRYPATLAEAGVADLNKDPFTGAEFIYRPSAQGFLVYSVGEDGRDDGGKRAAGDRSPGDIGPVSYFSSPVPPRPLSSATPGSVVWLK